jgi:ribonucleoside-diphosphate reductase alpha chain
LAELNEKGKKVFALKYSTKKSKMWRETCRDIADFIAQGGLPYDKTEREIKEIADKYFEYLYDLKFIPGGRIIANAGTGIKNLANCFVLEIDDSRISIYSTLKDAAEIFAMGGGVGYSFGKVREEGADIKTTGGQASGPLSFMSLFDQTGEVIQQASRRGAQLGSLSVVHPDIEKFIQFKSKLNSRNQRILEEYDRNLKKFDGRLKNTKYEKVLEKTLLDDQLTHFNISVLLTDDFMQAVEDDKDWNLVSPSSGKVVKTVKAKEILYLMATQAWESGDPGELFYDAINKDNMVSYLGNIEATNPCGEVPLLSGESCILTSINLFEIFNQETKQIDYELLKDITKTVTRFLEDVTEITEAPLDYINQTTKGLRRLGIGVLGFSDLLIELNIPYESKEAIELSKYLSWFINFHAWETSFELAKERGHFKYYDKNRAELFVVTKVLYDNPYLQSEINYEDLKNIGVRNVGVTSIAPTGSIAIIAGRNSAIEPFFSLAYKRNITEGIGNVAKDSIFETNPALERKLKEQNFNQEEINQILEYAFTNGTLTGCNLVSKEFQQLFKTANEIHWKFHVDIQSAWQLYISNAISKTVNISEKATVQDIYDIYLYMWKSGLKGGTIYRDNSKSFQILEKPVKK